MKLFLLVLITYLRNGLGKLVIYNIFFLYYQLIPYYLTLEEISHKLISVFFQFRQINTIIRFFTSTTLMNHSVLTLCILVSFNSVFPPLVGTKHKTVRSGRFYSKPESTYSFSYKIKGSGLTFNKPFNVLIEI